MLEHDIVSADYRDRPEPCTTTHVWQIDKKTHLNVNLKRLKKNCVKRTKPPNVEWPVCYAVLPWPRWASTASCRWLIPTIMTFWNIDGYWIIIISLLIQKTLAIFPRNSPPPMSPNNYELIACQGDVFLCLKENYETKSGREKCKFELRNCSF